MNEVITVLLPTRGRPSLAEKSIRSLIDRVANPGCIEILLGIDNDDGPTRAHIEQVIAPYLREKGVECRASIFEPMGHINLHQYVNTLANTSSGEWLMLWDDDALMQTQDWDNVVKQYKGQFKLLAPKDNHDGHPYAAFPIIPKDWYRLLEHISQHPLNDAWLSQIAYMLDIFERIDVDVLHDRADLTGNNDDPVFAASKSLDKLTGDPSHHQDFDSQKPRQNRLNIVYKIAWFLERIGEPSEFWFNVLEGKQDPFEKMVYQDGSKLEVPKVGSSPRPIEEVTGEPEITDDTMISL